MKVVKQLLVTDNDVQLFYNICQSWSVDTDLDKNNQLKVELRKAIIQMASTTVDLIPECKIGVKQS